MENPSHLSVTKKWSEHRRLRFASESYRIIANINPRFLNTYPARRGHFRRGTSTTAAIHVAHLRCLAHVSLHCTAATLTSRLCTPVFLTAYELLFHLTHSEGSRGKQVAALKHVSLSVSCRAGLSSLNYQDSDGRDHFER